MDATLTVTGPQAGTTPVVPFDLNGLKTYELKSRPSKVFVEELGLPLDGDSPMSAWIMSLPRLGAGSAFCRVRDRICESRKNGRTVVAAVGGRAVESGCGPYVADWVRRGVVHAVVLSGAAATHDFELALGGKTSEDITDQLSCGRYGMARDTADAFAVAARAGAENEVGLGLALGRHMETIGCAHPDNSIVLAAHRAGVPCTVHVSLGADTVHVHPHVCGAALGQASMIDFRRLCSVVTMLAHGVWINIGSAESIPETLLKATAVVCNFGHSMDGLLTVSIDPRASESSSHAALRQCAAENVSLAGNHELMLPLLHAAVACQWESVAPPWPAQAA